MYSDYYLQGTLLEDEGNHVQKELNQPKKKIQSRCAYDESKCMLTSNKISLKLVVTTNFLASMPIFLIRSSTNLWSSIILKS